jgi:hypothetical protein
MQLDTIYLPNRKKKLQVVEVPSVVILVSLIKLVGITGWYAHSILR